MKAVKTVKNLKQELTAKELEQKQNELAAKAEQECAEILNKALKEIEEKECVVLTQRIELQGMPVRYNQVISHKSKLRR